MEEQYSHLWKKGDFQLQKKEIPTRQKQFLNTPVPVFQYIFWQHLKKADPLPLLISPPAVFHLPYYEFAIAISVKQLVYHMYLQ